ncbi:ABC transporter permease [Prosthecodimorpha staleyi]|uniref:ABC transporter permease subunit n=1 Tax=Prosthecodimorpha staleyi TaxID=2840188 RepID=A0A947D3U5_9HYPH|nr:ABC transporter permease subunit [Prosthecodimorpha staleyi]MBT9290503.1 ABC transporter permease subunit [Prosthecodimorpha staleyi]
MLSYALRRLLGAIPTVFLVVTISFFLIRVAPGGPFDLERPLDPKTLENLNRVFGLDRPLPEQYWRYLTGLLRGDFGPSFTWRDFTVAELFAGALPVSMGLGGAALLIAILVGTGLGIAAAMRQNRAADHAAMAVATAGLTIPNFVVAPLLQITFGLVLGLLPVGGWNGGAWRNGVLPVIVLALPQIAVVARLTRASLIEQLRSPSIRTLRAAGLPERRVLAHALRAASLPVVSYLGPAAAALLTGSVVVETIFGIPGVGRFFVEGALNRDYTLVMGTVVLIAIFVIAVNLLVDLLYAVIDPRVRY